MGVEKRNRRFGIPLRTGERATTRAGENLKLHIIALRGDRTEGDLAGPTAQNLHGGVIDDCGIDGRDGVFFWGGGNEEREKEEEEANDFGKAMRAQQPLEALCKRWGGSAVIDRRYRRF